MLLCQLQASQGKMLLCEMHAYTGAASWQLWQPRGDPGPHQMPPCVASPRRPGVPCGAFVAVWQSGTVWQRVWKGRLRACTCCGVLRWCKCKAGPGHGWTGTRLGHGWTAGDNRLPERHDQPDVPIAFLSTSSAGGSTCDLPTAESKLLTQIVLQEQRGFRPTRIGLPWTSCRATR